MAPEKRLLSANMLLVRIADTDFTYPLKKVSNPKPTTHALLCYHFQTPSSLIK